MRACIGGRRPPCSSFVRAVHTTSQYRVPGYLPEGFKVERGALFDRRGPGLRDEKKVRAATVYFRLASFAGRFMRRVGRCITSLHSTTAG